MYLKELTLQGFKSFANKTTLTFTRKLTAVVGPNGSGKSNVADAIRWVLGEQSIKMLRGKSASDVIFAGSDQKSRLGFAEVSMTIDNAEGRIPVDYHELVITRRVYRDGQSEYYLNNAAVRLADVALLLAKSGFGQKSYSVIGQGLVDHVIVASPAERKEFFDEATGVKQFQLKREEAVRRLQKTRENLDQARSLFDEITPRLRSLKRQVNRLERREEVQGELRTTQHAYYRSVLTALEKELQTATQEFQASQAARATIEQRASELQTQLAALEKTTSRSQAFADLQQELTRLQQQRQTLQQQQAVLQGQRELQARQLGKEQMVWLEQQVQKLQHSIAQGEKQIVALQEQLSAAEKVQIEQQAALRQVDGRRAQLDERLHQLQQQLEQRTTVPLATIQERLHQLRQRLADLFAQLQKATSLEQVQRQLKQGGTVVAELQNFEHDLSGHVSEAEARHALALQQELSAMLKEKDAAAAQLQASETTVATLRQRLQSVAYELETQRVDLGKQEQELRYATAKDSVALASLVTKDLQSLNKQLADLDTRIAKVEGEAQDFNRAAEATQREVFNLQRELQQTQTELQRASSGVSNVELQRVRVETRLEDVLKEVQEELGPEAIAELRQPHAADAAVALEQLKSSIHQLKEQLAAIGGIDETVIAEYQQVTERHTFLETQIADLDKGVADLEKAVAELDRTIRRQFRESFLHIKKKFEEYFQVLFQGGKAVLYLEEAEIVDPADDAADEDDEGEGDVLTGQMLNVKSQKFITGVGVRATPPGKKLEDVSALSGGERAMTAIALICAIIANNPSPFVVLDEVDAALDEANSERFAAIVDQLAHKTQFVCITHNRATMRQAAVLYGVTMGADGVSKLLSVDLQQAVDKTFDRKLFGGSKVSGQ